MMSDAMPDPTSAAGPKISIEYCTGCRWLLRATWVAGELLTTFEEELAAVSLIPSGEGGVFRVRLDGAPIFDRKEAGGFPELRVLKQQIRDRVAPDRDLGHSELPAAGSGPAPGSEA